MQLPHEPQRERQRPETCHAVLQGGDVISYLPDIVGISPRGTCRDLFQQQLGQGRGRALDSGRLDGLSTHIGRDEQVRIGEVSSETRELAQCRVGSGQSEHNDVVVGQLRRQRGRDEGVIAPARSDHPPGFGGPEVARVHRPTSEL